MHLLNLLGLNSSSPYSPLFLHCSYLALFRVISSSPYPPFKGIPGRVQLSLLSGVVLASTRLSPVLRPWKPAVSINSSVSSLKPHLFPEPLPAHRQTGRLS